MIKDLIKWLKEHFTRKFTVPFHVLGGMLCVFLYPFYPGLSITLVIAFGLFELWQAAREGDTGYLDFWDWLFGMSIAAGILLIRSI